MGARARDVEGVYHPPATMLCISDPNQSPEQLLLAELRRDLYLAKAYLKRAVGLD